MLSEIIQRLTRYLLRQKIIIKDEDPSHLQLEIDESDTFTKLQAHSVTYRFATGPTKGKKALVLRSMGRGSLGSDSDHNTKKDSWRQSQDLYSTPSATNLGCLHLIVSSIRINIINTLFSDSTFAILSSLCLIVSRIAINITNAFN